MPKKLTYERALFNNIVYIAMFTYRSEKSLEYCYITHTDVQSMYKWKFLSSAQKISVTQIKRHSHYTKKHHRNCRKKGFCQQIYVDAIVDLRFFFCVCHHFDLTVRRQKILLLLLCLKHIRTPTKTYASHMIKFSIINIYFVNFIYLCKFVSFSHLYSVRVKQNGLL